MTLLTRAQIAQARDFTLKEVSVEEWGGSVYLRSITVGALDEIQIRYMQLAGGSLLHQNGASDSLLAQHPELLRDMKPRLLSYSLCDDQGVLLFDDNEGRAILRSKDPAVIDRLYTIAEGLSGMGAGAVEEEKKSLRDNAYARFQLTLCLSLGWSLAELKWRMSAKELQRWWAWYHLEPWGETRGDLRMSILASSLVNMWMGKGKKTTPADFLPDWYKVAPFTPKPRQSAQEMLAVFRRGTAAVGGHIHGQVRLR